MHHCACHIYFTMINNMVGKMDNRDYHTVRVETPTEFMEQLCLLVLEERYPRVKFEVSPSIWPCTYANMQDRIERNNIVKGRVDNIVNMRNILSDVDHPRIWVRYFHEILNNYNERWTNWIAVIPPGPRRSIVGVGVVIRDTNSLSIRVIIYGNYDWMRISSWKWHDDDDDDMCLSACV